MVRRQFLKTAAGLFVPTLAFGQVYLPHRRKAFQVSATPSYILEENFDGSGKPTGWGTAGGTVDYDYATTALQGNQALRLTNTSSLATSAFTSSVEVDVYFQVYVLALPTVRRSILSIQSTNLAICRLATDGKIDVFANGGDSTATTNAMALNTKYHVWLSFVSSGTCSVAFSSDGIRPTSGTSNFSSRTGASGSGTTINITTDSSADILYDRLLVLTSGKIGNNP
jgi:hypothetical protein